MLQLSDLKTVLTSDLHPIPKTNSKKIASVLITIFGTNPAVVMTKKSSILKMHAGEIAFPGGKYDSDDVDLIETALRESREEINLSITRDHVIGQLSPVTTLNSGYTIYPFISVIRRLPRLKDNVEVESILPIPLEPLLNTLKSDDDPLHQSIQEMYVFTFKNHLIWGASARMLKEIHDILRKKGLVS